MGFFSKLVSKVSNKISKTEKKILDKTEKITNEITKNPHLKDGIKVLTGVIAVAPVQLNVIEQVLNAKSTSSTNTAIVIYKLLEENPEDSANFKIINGLLNYPDQAKIGLIIKILITMSIEKTGNSKFIIDKFVDLPNTKKILNILSKVVTESNDMIAKDILINIINNSVILNKPEILENFLNEVDIDKLSVIPNKNIDTLPDYAKNIFKKKIGYPTPIPVPMEEIYNDNFTITELSLLSEINEEEFPESIYDKVYFDESEKDELKSLEENSQQNFLKTVENDTNYQDFIKNKENSSKYKKNIGKELSETGNKEEQNNKSHYINNSSDKNYLDNSYSTRQPHLRSGTCGKNQLGHPIDTCKIDPTIHLKLEVNDKNILTRGVNGKHTLNIKDNIKLISSHKSNHPQFESQHLPTSVKPNYERTVYPLKLDSHSNQENNIPMAKPVHQFDFHNNRIDNIGSGECRFKTINHMFFIDSRNNRLLSRSDSSNLKSCKELCCQLDKCNHFSLTENGECFLRSGDVDEMDRHSIPNSVSGIKQSKNKRINESEDDNYSEMNSKLSNRHFQVYPENEAEAELSESIDLSKSPKYCLTEEGNVSIQPICTSPPDKIYKTISEENRPKCTRKQQVKHVNKHIDKYIKTKQEVISSDINFKKENITKLPDHTNIVNQIPHLKSDLGINIKEGFQNTRNNSNIYTFLVIMIVFLLIYFIIY